MAHLRRRTRPRVLLAVAVVALAIGVPAASAFTIGIGTTFFSAAFEPHGGSAVHEAITAEAVRAGYPAASAALVLDLQRGVENADITHQFDSETHFDNSSLSLNGGRAVPGRTPNFAGAFDTAHARFAAAVKLAKGNPQFLNPDFKIFGDLVASVRTTFAKLAVLPTCIATTACPTTFFAAQAARLTVWGAALEVDPDPDPHQSTGETSIFAQRCPRNAAPMCGVLSGVNSYYTTMFPALAAALDRAYAALKKVYGATDVDTLAVQRYRQDLDAYLAYQWLGHALHSTEDFFAHSNYVELMAGVEPGTRISTAKPAVKPGTIAVPASWSAFTIAGVSKLLGARALRLESGAVGAVWLKDGDFCHSAADVFFNPIYLSFLKRPSIAFDPWPKVTWLPVESLGLGGTNPNPPAGFQYCHYPTATTVGLNKDDAAVEKNPSRSSHPNHAYARAAAVQMAGVLWCDFLTAIGSSCGEGGSGGSGGSFGAPVALSPKGVTGRYPAAGVDAAGNATVVWTQIGATHDLRYAVHAKGAWSAPVAIAGSTAFQPEDVVLAESPNGNVVVAANGNRVVAALKRGGPTFAPLVALSPRGNGDSYQAAISDSGRAVVVWRTDQGTVQFAVAEPGTGFGAATTIPTGGAEAADPVVGIDSAGNAVLAWKTDDGSGEAAISYALLPRGGKLGAARSLGAAAGAHGVDTMTALDVAPDGTVALAWDFVDECDDCAWIFALHGAVGTTTAGLGSGFPISDARDVPNGGKVYYYATVMGAGGTAGFAWNEAIDGGDRLSFRSGRGGALGGYQHVSASPSLIRMAALGNRLLVAWLEQTDGGDRVRVASSTGGALAIELTRGPTSIGGFGLAANRAGAAVVAWNQTAGGDNRVFAATAG